jgi:hypothetical protein
MRHSHNIRPRDLCQPGWDTWIADALGLTDYSDDLPRTLLAKCLLVAAALGAAVSAVTRRVADLGRETVRKGINAALPDDPRTLEDRLAAGLRHALPRGLRGLSLPIAIDIHRRAYYGNRRRTPGITGGQAEAGAYWFWSYATAVSLQPGYRHTLAVTAVGPSDSLTDVVERLLMQVSWSGVKVRYVLMDRAFYAAGVVWALQRRKLRFIIPMVRRGQEGLKFFRRGCRGWFDHTFQSRRREHQATVRVAVVGGPDGNRPLVFACSEGFDVLPDVALRYGRRFGIESSYRQLGECLAVTSSRDVVYRLLLVGLSLLIRAWWACVSNTTLNHLRWNLIVTLTPTTSPTVTFATQTLTTQAHTTT